MAADTVLVGGVPATELAQRWGTPLYAYDAGSIRDRYARLIDAIDYRPMRVYYSAKANAALGILRLLRELGAALDACSPGDLLAADRAGYGDHVSYVGIGASDADLDAVLRANAYFVADSIGQVTRYAARLDASELAGRGGELGLRVNPAARAPVKAVVQAGAWDAKFGIHAGQVGAVAEQCAAWGLRITGLHAHIGSDLPRPEPHLQTLRLLLELAEELPHVRNVSLGGGLAVADDEVADYPVEELGAGARELLDDFDRRTGRRLELRLEPGGYLLMDSGVLLTTVTDIKPSVPVGDAVTPTFVCVDSSYNHVVSAVVHGTRHPVRLARAARVDGEAPAPVTIVGNLMQAGDVIARDRVLPGLRVGDLLVVGRCGAYTSSRSTTFNERPRPAEVLVDGGRATVLRRAETIDDLFARDG